MAFFTFRNRTRFFRIRKKRLKLLLLFVLVFAICFLMVYWRNIRSHGLIEREPPRYVTDLCFVLNKNLLAVILVNSATTNENRRQLIRSTWANKYLCRALKIAVVFVVGSSADSHVERAVVEEKKRFGDILKVSTVDSYRHLVEKIVNGIEWTLENCPSTRFILKIDDDVFLNIFALQKYLEEATVHQNANHFVCLLWPSIKVQRDPRSKWYISEEEYPHPTYPPYCSGSAYLMPRAVARVVDRLYRHVPTFWIEDVYLTGFLAKEGNLGHFQAGHFYGFVDYKYDSVIRGDIVFAHINRNETLIKNALWKHILDFQKEVNNPLVVVPETYHVQNISTFDDYDYY